MGRVITWDQGSGISVFWGSGLPQDLTRNMETVISIFLGIRENRILALESGSQPHEIFGDQIRTKIKFGIMDQIFW